MKYFLLIISFLLSGLFFFPACKKKEDEPGKTTMLTGYNWVVTSAKLDPAITVAGNPTPVSSIYDQMEPCYKDDKTKFESSGTYTVNIGTNICSTEKNYGSDWKFQNSETTIMINNFGNTGTPLTFSLNEFSTHIMTLQLTITTGTQLNTILRAYGFPTAKANEPAFQSGTKFTVVMRTL